MHGIVVPTGTVNALAWAHPIEPTLSVNRNGLTPLLSYPRAHTGGSLQSSQFVDCIAGKEGAWFATCGQIADAWEPDDDDRRKFDLPDVRGVETLPSPGVAGKRLDPELTRQQTAQRLAQGRSLGVAWVVIPDPPGKALPAGRPSVTADLDKCDLSYW